MTVAVVVSEGSGSLDFAVGGGGNEDSGSKRQQNKSHGRSGGSSGSSGSSGNSGNSGNITGGIMAVARWQQCCVGDDVSSGNGGINGGKPAKTTKAKKKKFTWIKQLPNTLCATELKHCLVWNAVKKTCCH